MEKNSLKPLHPTYRPDIDGLRAIAVLGVVGFHAFPNQLSGGFIGVDIFFVISGYLITSIILKNLLNDSFSFLNFYAQRIRRIFPALFTIFLFCYILGWLTLFPDEFSQLGKHIAGGAGFVSNWVLLGESGYFDGTAESKVLLHLWSLGIEEQFYLVFPLIFWGAWKRKLNIYGLICVILIASFSLNLFLLPKLPIETFYSPFTRIWELLIGSAIAYQGIFSSSFLSSSKKPKLLFQAHSQNIKNITSIGGFAALIVGQIILNKDMAFPGWWALIPSLGAAFIIYAGPAAIINRLVLSNKNLIWFGLISYPLYLWHWPILTFGRIWFGESSPEFFRVIAVAVSIFFAWLTYQFIEKPIRFGNSKNVKTFFLLLIVFTMGLVGYITYKSEGFRFRPINSQLQKFNAEVFNQLGSEKNTSCLELLGKSKVKEEICATNSNAPSTLFIGDSHAMAAYSSIFTGIFSADSALISGHSCVLYPNLSYTIQMPRPYGNNCPAIAKDALNFSAKNNSIKNIFIVVAAQILKERLPLFIATKKGN